MNLRLRITLVFALFLFFILVFYLLKRKRINIKYSLLWLLTGFGMLIPVIFPSVLNKTFMLLGISDPLNGLFSLLLFFILILIMSLTAIVSRMNERNRETIQTIALLEKRVRDLEDKQLLMSNKR